MKLNSCILLKLVRTSDSIEIGDSLNEENTSNDRISSTTLQYVYTSTGNHSCVFEESNSELSVTNVCANSNLSGSVSIGGDVHSFESENHDSVVHSSNNAQESFQLSPMSPSLSMNVIGNIEYVPPNTIATISCSGISVYETVMEESVLYQTQESILRHFDEWNNIVITVIMVEMKRIYNHFYSTIVLPIPLKVSQSFTPLLVFTKSCQALHFCNFSFRFANNNFK